MAITRLLFYRRKRPGGLFSFRWHVQDPARYFCGRPQHNLTQEQHCLAQGMAVKAVVGRSRSPGGFLRIVLK